MTADDSTCEVCAGTTLDALRAKEAALIAKYGWYSHYVFDDPAAPLVANIHTHGFAETWGHPDFQIVLPLSQAMAHAILGNLAERVRDGAQFSAYTLANDIITDLPITFVVAKEGDRAVLRVILPDPAGNLEPNDMGERYARQYEGTVPKTRKDSP